MEKTGKFEFLEHTADILIAAHGQTLEEAFENAALAIVATDAIQALRLLLMASEMRKEGGR